MPARLVPFQSGWGVQLRERQRSAEMAGFRKSNRPITPHETFVLASAVRQCGQEVGEEGGFRVVKPQRTASADESVLTELPHALVVT